MNWKQQLFKLEQHKEWDFAIDYMQTVIAENPDDIASLVRVCTFRTMLE